MEHFAKLEGSLDGPLTAFDMLQKRIHDEKDGENAGLSALQIREKRLIRCATYVQRNWRVRGLLFEQFAHIIFSKKNGAPRPSLTAQ